MGYWTYLDLPGLGWGLDVDARVKVRAQGEALTAELGTVKDKVGPITHLCHIYIERENTVEAQKRALFFQPQKG